jgi:hypothetical protein
MVAEQSCKVENRQLRLPLKASNVVANTTNGMKENIKNTGKQRAGEARDKAINKANDSLQNLMNKITK